MPSDGYANSMRESFHNVYISNHKVYTLNIFEYLTILFVNHTAKKLGKRLH